ncbi:MAG: response regulator transcription factor [Gammaproteobacteria bacterium]|nr:response regulator transcription factor [Gammaproteobacteria bacterium]MBQ0838430.1 response regulator transcription factor [Gammaproteobacteria bacterium]
MNVLIVDDEPLARDRLQRMVALLPDFNVVAMAENGQQAIQRARESSPDVVLMDVRMPGMDGIAAAQHLAELDPPPAVIFCTAYEDYAIEAFSSQAIGYLLKPVKQTDLAAALSRTGRVNKAQLNSLQDTIGIGEGGRTHLASKNRGEIDLIALSNVRLFQADHKYVTVYHTNGEALLDDTLKELESEFEGRFVRIHRNALVSVLHIEGLERDSEGHCFVRLSGLDIKPQVSRRHITPVRRLLEKI